MIQGQVNARKEAAIPLQVRGANGQIIDRLPVIDTGDGSLVGMSMLYGYRLFMDVIDGGDVIIEERP